MEATWDSLPPPPLPRPPMSGAAITAFVLSLVIGLFSLVGVWWANAVPLAVAALAWPGISKGRRRGGGFAIAAALISVLAGIGVYALWHEVSGMMARSFGHTLAVVDQGDEAEVRKRISSDEDADAVLLRLKERVEKVHASFGRYAGETSIPMGWFGPIWTLIFPPGDVEEVGGEGEIPSLGQGKHAWFWFQAKFERATLWVAFEIGRGEAEASDEPKEEFRFGPIRDVRFFRSR